MSLNLASMTFAHARAARASQLRGRVAAVDSYYFGYWFSHKRA